LLRPCFFLPMPLKKDTITTRFRCRYPDLWGTGWLMFTLRGIVTYRSRNNIGGRIVHEDSG
jgi:hypothetical protein